MRVVEIEAGDGLSDAEVIRARNLVETGKNGRSGLGVLIEERRFLIESRSEIDVRLNQIDGTIATVEAYLDSIGQGSEPLQPPRTPNLHIVEPASNNHFRAHRH